MDSDAKLNILTEALAAAGASALAIDARGDVAISTMNDAALERDVVTFVAERLDRIGRRRASGYGACGYAPEPDRSPHRQRGRVPLVVVVREVRGAAAHAGIEWLNADEVEARYESSAYGIVEGRPRWLRRLPRATRAVCPFMLEGELGAGQVEIAKRLYLDGPLPINPLFPLRSMSFTDRGWRHVLKSVESPLFQTG